MKSILLSAAAAVACGAVVGLSAYALPTITAPGAPLARPIVPSEGALDLIARGESDRPGHQGSSQGSLRSR